MVTQPLPWTACSNARQPSQWRNFFINLCQTDTWQRCYSCQVVLGQYRDWNMGISGSNWARDDLGSSAFPSDYNIHCFSHEVVISFKPLHLATPAKKSLSNKKVGVQWVQVLLQFRSKLTGVTVLETTGPSVPLIASNPSILSSYPMVACNPSVYYFCYVHPSSLDLPPLLHKVTGGFFTIWWVMDKKVVSTGCPCLTKVQDNL